MKVLWKTNVMLPIVADRLNLKRTEVAGWLIGLSEEILKNDSIELGICFPVQGEAYLFGSVGKLRYFGFPHKKTDPSKYDQSIETYLFNIIIDFQPDIVHIFGSEFPHTLAMTKVFGKPDRTIINIQGLASIIAQHYTLGLSPIVRKSSTFRDFIRHDGIIQQVHKMFLRGRYEVAAIKNVDHVVGRTDWDEACTKKINPAIQYHICPETLRTPFYENSWNILNVERHSIFFSQAYYPVKGLHLVLNAFADLLRNYPDASLYVAGEDIFTDHSLKGRLRKSFYAHYIEKRMKKLKIMNRVVFLGILDEKQMCAQYLKSHVFLSASTIENESNSLSEAKLLGVPSVASFVGGVTNRIIQGIDGFLFPLNEPYMIAHYISKIFEDDGLATRVSISARTNALKLFDKEKNLETMMEIYQKVLKS